LAPGAVRRVCHASAEGTATTSTPVSSSSSFIGLNCSTKDGKLSYSRRMAVDPELLEILACPKCKTPVALVKDGTALKCANCKRVYPIKDDIPIMLIDEATIED